jgi:ribokinase
MYGKTFQRSIAVVGSINADLVCRVDKIPQPGETRLSSNFRIHSGGKGANQAVAAARLGCNVHLIGKLGKDAFGNLLQKGLTDASVDISGIDLVEEASGVALIEVSAEGENSIVVAPGANACVTPGDLDKHIDVLRQAGIVLTQLEIPLDTVKYLAQICHCENIPLILDPAPAQELPDELLRATTWFTPNETEAAFYTAAQDPESQCQALLKRGLTGIVLKRGAHGISLATSSLRRIDQPGFRVQAVDSTAAGDAFNGAFAAALMLGSEPAAAARFASAAAAISVTRLGAQASMASRAEVDHFLEQHQEA